MPTAPVTPSPNLTIEAIVAVDAPREFRLHPRDRVVAYTAEAAGTRQLFTLSLRGGYPTQVTASEKPVSDPQWSPDGRRLAFVRDEEIWVVESDGSRLTRVVGKPAGGREPRWSPDGHRLAFLSRRRGWTQVWLIDAPVPRRGRPAIEPKPPRARVLTESGIDVDAFEWSPDGTRIAVMAPRRPEAEETSQIALVDVASGESRVVAGERSVDVGARWLPDGSLLFTSDADGWFQVVRLTADGHDRIVLTAGEREHGDPGGGIGFAPLPSPDGSRFVHVEVHDGLQDLLVGELTAGSAPKRGRGRPPKTPRTVSAASAGCRINPWDGGWRAVGGRATARPRRCRSSWTVFLRRSSSWCRSRVELLWTISMSCCLSRCRMSTSSVRPIWLRRWVFEETRTMSALSTKSTALLRKSPRPAGRPGLSPAMQRRLSGTVEPGCATSCSTERHSPRPVQPAFSRASSRGSNERFHHSSGTQPFQLARRPPKT